MDGKKQKRMMLVKDLKIILQECIEGDLDLESPVLLDLPLSDGFIPIEQVRIIENKVTGNKLVIITPEKEAYTQAIIDVVNNSMD